MSYIFMNEILGWAVDDEIRVRRSLSLFSLFSLKRGLLSLRCCGVLASQRKERNRERTVTSSKLQLKSFTCLTCFFYMIAIIASARLDFFVRSKMPFTLMPTPTTSTSAAC